MITFDRPLTPKFSALEVGDTFYFNDGYGSEACIKIRPVVFVDGAKDLVYNAVNITNGYLVVVEEDQPVTTFNATLTYV